jgi:hypothetical protein
MFNKELLHVSKQIQDKLAETRSVLMHSGSKGSHAEEALRSVFRRYLPRRFAIGQGEIIDTKNNRSGQTDIVVISEDHPFIFPEDEPGLFLIEGVLAAGEVKSVLTGDELHRAIASSQRFKALEAVEAEGTLRMAKPADLPRFHTSRPWFLFAYESELALATVYDRIVEAADGLKEHRDRQVDAVFPLDRGVLFNLGNGEGSFAVAKPDGTRHSGWVLHETDQVLFALISWLSIVMPRSNRLVPILPDYLVAIAR